VGAFIAGFGTGRLKKEKRLLWGLCAGALYFCVILLVSIVSGMGLRLDAGRLIKCVIICLASGAIGGIIG
jgi:putative membrane protein (TIGR04086 family)